VREFGTYAATKEDRDAGNNACEAVKLAPGSETVVTLTGMGAAYTFRCPRDLGFIFGREAPGTERRSARWRSGYAAACKAVYTGSIPVRASTAVTANGRAKKVAAVAMV
jgi:hypothetical protein